MTISLTVHVPLQYFRWDVSHGGPEPSEVAKRSVTTWYMDLFLHWSADAACVKGALRVKCSIVERRIAVVLLEIMIITGETTSNRSLGD
jgi:hypothetical protein